MLTRLDRYVIKQIITPLSATLGIAALLLVLERMLRLFDFVVNQGGPVDVVWSMLANLLPHYLGLALPIGLFLGILLAFRKISLSSEYDAMTSAGLGLSRLVRPALLLAMLLLVINTVLVGWVQPHSRYNYRGMVFDLRSGALGASIRVGEFVEFGDNVVLRIDESHNQGADLVGIFMERRNGNKTTAISAKRGGFFSTSDQNTIILRLYDGVLVELNENQSKPRVLRVEQQDLKIKLPTAEPFRGRMGEELEQTLPELWQNMDSPALDKKQQLAYQANFHWRLMHSLTFLILPFLAIPMGLTNKRTGKSTGLVIGLFILVLYNELMEGMETAIATDVASPYTSVWLLFSLLAALSFALFYTVAFRVGVDPLKWFNRAWEVISKPIRIAAKWVVRAKEA